MRIAWFSPPPTLAGTKAQYFSELVVPRLREHFEIELFGDGERHEGIPTSHSAYRRHREKPFDLFFYQVEDHRSNAFARHHLGLLPGVVLFHDALFTVKAPEALLHSAWEPVTDAQRRGVPLELPKGEVWPEKHNPFGLREAHLAHLALFTNPWAHGEFQRQVAGKGLSDKSFFLPFPVELSDRDLEHSGSAIGFVGAPSMEHRAHKLLQALSTFRNPPELVWLLDQHEKEWAEALCKDSGVSNVRFVIGRNPEQWIRVLPELSIAVHTLFSVYGGIGPYLELSLAHGVPSITTRFGAGDHLPRLATVQIDAGDSEARALETAIRELKVTCPWNAAREYVQEVHDVKVVTHELTSLLKREQKALSAKLSSWKEMSQTIAAKVLADTLNREEPIVQRLMSDEFRAMGWER